MQPDGSTDYIVGMDFSVAGTCSEVVKAKMKVVATAKACVNFGWEVCLIDARKNDWVYFHMAPKVPPNVEQFIAWRCASLCASPLASRLL